MSKCSFQTELLKAISIFNKKTNSNENKISFAKLFQYKVQSIELIVLKRDFTFDLILFNEVLFQKGKKIYKKVKLYSSFFTEFIFY